MLGKLPAVDIWTFSTYFLAQAQSILNPERFCHFGSQRMMSFVQF